MIQAQSISAATATVAPTVLPLAFYDRKLFWVLRCCGLNPTQEIFLPTAWKQLKSDTINKGNKSVLTCLLDPSNMIDDEVVIFLIKQLVTYITTQNFYFGYTTAYGIAHYGITPFSVPSLDPATMAQLYIYQPAYNRATMIFLSDKKISARGTPHLPLSYT